MKVNNIATTTQTLYICTCSMTGHNFATESEKEADDFLTSYYAFAPTVEKQTLVTTSEKNWFRL